jgi:hypothetical protein
MADGLRQSIGKHRTLLERDRELRALDSALSDLCDPVDGVARARRGGLLALAGSAGLGKTTLMAEARARAMALGCTVLSGKGGEKEQELAFRVVRQLVQPILATMGETSSPPLSVSRQGTPAVCRTRSGCVTALIGS